MKVLSALTLISLFVGSVYASPFSISEREINHYLQNHLAEKVPLQDTVGIPPLFQLDYRLHNLTTKIGQTPEKRVEVSGIIDGLLTAKGKKYNARIALNMDTVPYYDSEKGALFLKDIRLLNWTATPEKYQNELHIFLPLLVEGLAGVLNQTAVYTLDEQKSKEALVKKFGKAIVVEKGEIRLETSLFN